MAMKTNEKSATAIIVALLFLACHATPKEKVDTEIAPLVYIALTEKSLDYLASFQLDSFAEMVADSVEYELPDGTKLIGKKALINYWENYKTSSGIQSMKIMKANYLPIDTHVKLTTNECLGVKVVADFTNDMILNNKNISVKMNFNFHFNQQKLIDRINSNYDQTLIGKLKKPILEQ
jgi:hypothetical protein